MCEGDMTGNERREIFEFEEPTLEIHEFLHCCIYSTQNEQNVFYIVRKGAA